jgi:hypothetical protein
MSKQTCSVETLRRIALSMPGVEEGTSYRTLAFRVGGKLLARLYPDGKSVVLMVEFGEREILMEGEPETFYITEHYRNYPAMLARLANLHPDELRRLLTQTWQKYAPKRIAKQSKPPSGRSRSV